MGPSQERAEIMTHRISLTQTAFKMLGAISDQRVREKIKEAIDDLAQDPEKRGKPLIGDLTGYRCIRAVGQRYRIIYSVDRNRVLVLVIALGLRKEGSKKDIYELAKKLIKQKLVEVKKDSKK